jgi:hypothetical protein
MPSPSGLAMKNGKLPSVETLGLDMLSQRDKISVDIRDVSFDLPHTHAC